MAVLISFQSTPPRGGRHGGLRVGPFRYVSIHAPARRATPTCCGPTRSGSCFNPRPRAGGDIMPAAFSQSRAFQSTPPRGGRLGREFAFPLLAVSIHAPARGATRAVERGAVIQKVSIHAPARGATFSSGPRWLSCGFNPRPRAGGDARLPTHRTGLCIVSIHAPARGATANSSCTTTPQSFNPRPRAGGDTGTTVTVKLVAFQSTPPRGGRPHHADRHHLARRFNPRPRAGGDVPVAEAPVSVKFQSTPPRGGRQFLSAPNALQRGFNPRPRAGGD